MIVFVVMGCTSNCKMFVKSHFCVILCVFCFVLGI